MKTRQMLLLAAALAGAIGFKMMLEDSATSTEEATKPAEDPGFHIDPAVYNWPPKGSKATTLVPEDRRFAKNFYVILDGSGSMNEKECADDNTKAQVAVDTLQKFAKTVPEDANLGLLIFDDTGTSERVPLGINNRPQFASALAAMKVGSGTPLKSAITRGLAKIEDQARAQMGYGEYNLVVVTDGYANKGEDPKAVVHKMASGTPVLIHTMGFCIGSEHSLNQPGLTIYKSANNPKELATGLGSVLAESETFDVTDFK